MIPAPAAETQSLMVTSWPGQSASCKPNANMAQSATAPNHVREAFKMSEIPDGTQV